MIKGHSFIGRLVFLAAAVVATLALACTKEIQVPVEKVVEVVKEVEIEKIVEVIKEVEVEKIVEVVREVEVEKIIEVIREIEVEKIVEVVAQPRAAAVVPQPTPLPSPLGLKNPGTLVKVTIGEPATLDPAWHYDNGSGEVIFNVYEPLLFYKRERIDEFVPLLSTGWNISSDGRTYAFDIRQGVQFHEGGTLEPHDVAYSIRRGLFQDRAGGPQWVLLDPILGVASIEELATSIAGVDDFADVDAASLVAACERVKQAVAFDDTAWTVTFNLARPFGPFLQIMASTWGVAMDQEWMVSQGAWDGDCATWTKWHDPTAEESVVFSKMNGTGPFKFERWLKGDEWSIVRNENYWLADPLWEGGPSGPAALDRVVVKAVEEWGTRLAMFQAGDADFLFVPRQFVSQVDPSVAEQYEGGVADPASLTIINPDGFARLFKNIPTVGSVDAFFTFQVDTEGGNAFVGSGKLDGLGIPPDFFADLHVRKAFSYAFDYQTFIDDIFLGEATRRTGPIISGHIGYSPDQFVYPFDAAKAEEEFRLAFDGELWDTGFFMTLLYNSGNDQRKAAAEILETSIESINPGKFHLTVQGVPWPTYIGQIVQSRMPLFFIGWLEDYHHPNNWVTPYLASTGTFAAWQKFPEDLSAQFDSLVAECVKLLGEEARVCYETLQTTAMDNAVDIFLVQAVGRHYEQLWVDGYYNNPAYPGNWFYSLSK